METLADRAKTIKNTDVLTEHVRQALGRIICQQYQKNGVLTVLTVEPNIERIIQDTGTKSQGDPYSAVDPNWLQKFYTGLLTEIEKISSEGIQPVILCTSGARIHLKRLLERVLPNVAVISFSEVVPDIKVEAKSLITLDKSSDKDFVLTQSRRE
jgi:flagellar biosynthesis protein FlhA